MVFTSTGKGAEPLDKQRKENHPMKILNALINAALGIVACIFALAAIPPGIAAAAMLVLARTAQERIQP